MILFEQYDSAATKKVLQRHHFLPSLVIAVFFFCLNVPPAQALTVRPLNLELGHQSDLTTFTTRDNQGFLWIASDNGVKRYDGYRLQTYTYDKTKPNGIGAGFIAIIMQDSHNNIWAAGGTLNLYHSISDSFSSYSFTNGKITRTLYEDNNILWLGGEGYGLKGFDLNKKEVIHTLLTAPDTLRIQSIIKNKDQSLLEGRHKNSAWILAGEKVLFFDTRKIQFQEYTIPKSFGLDQFSATSMIQDKHGKLWITSHKGLITFTPKTETFEHYQADKHSKGGLPTNELWNIFEDSKGAIWIGTDKQGVIVYEPNTDSFIHYPPSPTNTTSVPLAGIGKINEDFEGNLWLSTSVAGVRRISPHLEKFYIIQHKDSNQQLIKQGYLSEMIEDSNANIWTAIDGMGLNFLNTSTQKFTHYKHDPNDSNSLSTNSVLSITEDENGIIWVGTWVGGLNRFDPKSGNFTRIQHATGKDEHRDLAGNNIFRVVADRQGSLLLSVWEFGLQVYDINNQTFKTFRAGVNGNKSTSILDILSNNDGTFWLGGYQGLEKFDLKNEVFTSINLPDIETIIDIHKSDDMTLWLATNTGLVEYDIKSKSIRNQFTTQEGLSNNFVVSIEEDSQGYLWLGTRDGLNSFNPKTKEFMGYGKLDGLAGQKFNRFAHLTTKDKKMFFGGKDGLNYFDPIYMPLNPNVPQIHLTGFKLFQAEISPKNSEWMKEDINTLKTLTLAYNQNDMSFEFSALNLITPTKNQYRYTLEGFNKKWIDTDSRNRTAHYSNLNPGKYTFKVFGSNNDGVWSQKPKQLDIIILPPWWLTWWAKTLYVTLLLLLIFAFSQWLLHINQKRQRLLEYKLKHDLLTGLPNRIWLIEHINQLIKRNKSNKQSFCVLFLDGDNFKKFNDKYGHDQGDLLIKKAPIRIKQALPDHASITRLEGDQFVIIIDDVSSQESAENLAQKLIDTFDEPLLLNNVTVKFKFNIGLLISNKQYRNAQDILKNAETALYSAKKSGSGSWRAFDETMRKNAEEDSTLAEDLTLAAAKNQLSVVYQPIITLSTGTLNGFEILLRWTHPEKGMIPPDKFIPIAEQNGLIFEIGLWVITQACLQQQQWKREHPLITPPSLAVNLSPMQLVHSNFISEFDKIVAFTGADITTIKLEITETALMEDLDIVNHTLDELRTRGVELAIDDFGTGYSSMSYLGKLPAQFLKIDRSFVDGMNKKDSKGSKEIIKATISLAHNLRMKVVAEGIETQQQLDELKSYGCDFGQGYFIDRPLTTEDATALVIKTIKTAPI